MPSPFLSNPSSTTSSNSSQNDTVASSSSSSAVLSTSSSSTTSPTDMWNFVRIPMLISLSKEFSAAKAQSTIFLPSDQDDAVSRSVLPQEVPRCPRPDPKLNFRPVIGILSHPGDGASGRLSKAKNASYIAAPYVEFVESVGARVIPLIYNEPKAILLEKLKLVNGVLYTGGRVKSGLYYETVGAIFKEVLQKNDAGDHFPLYAICLGFELLTMIISQLGRIGFSYTPIPSDSSAPLQAQPKDRNILGTFNATDQASTLQFIKNTSTEGTVFQRFPPDLLGKLSTDCLVMQNHHYGISPKRMQKNLDLCRFFKILTTSRDKDDKVYVSTVQANNYPVTAFQWHPEKKGIPHSEDAIQVTQHVANYFVSEARKSMNRPPARQVLDNLIYNYSPTYRRKAGKGYDKVYIFT